MPDETKREVEAPARPTRKRTAAGVAIQVAEAGINDALLILGKNQPEALRKALLKARGDIREAVGEART